MATQVEPEVARRRFSADEFLRMAEVGILGEQDRVELIDGEIVEMHPIGTPHHRCVALLTRLLVRALGDEWLVGVQGPVQAGEHGLPLPDLAVFRADALKESHADATETPLVIEVADTSLRYDRNVKLALYARYGYLEAWIVDLVGEAAECHSGPSANGYRRTRRAVRGEAVEAEALAGLTLRVDDILG